jgi:hypothetical protein
MLKNRTPLATNAKATDAETTGASAQNSDKKGGHKKR